MFSSLALGAVIAVALLIVPVSYVRTVGQDVALTFSAPGLGKEAVDAIAKEYRTTLGGDGVRVSVEEAGCEAAGSQRTYHLATHVASKSRGATERVATAFAGALANRGIAATVAVSPRTEKVSGNVYAAAGNSICSLTIDRTGKTAEELEASIRSQLEAAGVQNPTVDVAVDGDRTTVQIQCQGTGCQPGAGQCEIKLKLDDAGAGDANETNEANVVTLQCDPNTTPEQLKAHIEEELRSRGINANVTVTSEGADGQRKIEVKVEKQ